MYIYVLDVLTTGGLVVSEVSAGEDMVPLFIGNSGIMALTFPPRALLKIIARITNKTKEGLLCHLLLLA